MQTAQIEHGIAKYIPILGWLPVYPRGDFRFDLVAGLTASAVVIPQAMAYATIAGLPVVVVQASTISRECPTSGCCYQSAERRYAISSRHNEMVGCHKPA